MRRSTWRTAIFGAALLFLATASPVSACPMCKLATESASRQPKAYMYSILFMMGMPMMISTGFGIGANPASDPPNLLRVWLGQEKSALSVRNLLVIETNIDDMNPEFYNYVSGKLFALGALDVSLVPVQMKKNRPGVLLRALVEPSMETAAAEIILSETTTLGIRVLEVRRIELPREEKMVSTVFGQCKVKRSLLPNGSERLIPEYEECRRIAEETGTPLPDVYRRIIESAK